MDRPDNYKNWSSNMTGSRKLKGFYHTLYSVVGLTLSALFSGKVAFSGDNYSTIILAVCVLAGAFFGANFGEHWSKALTTKVNGGAK